MKLAFVNDRKKNNCSFKVVGTNKVSVLTAIFRYKNLSVYPLFSFWSQQFGTIQKNA
jgi:hypothetical protein